MNFREALLSRAQWRTADLAPITREIERALNTVDTLNAEVARIRADDRLTPGGQIDAIRTYLKEATAPNLYVAQRVPAAMHEKIAARRKSLEPKAPDPSDLAGAIVRNDVRALLRGMSPAQRLGLILAENADSILHAAILEAPAFASGIDDETKTKVADAAIRRSRPAALDQLARQSEATVVMEQAARHTINAAIRAADFPTVAVFDDFLNEAVASKVAALDASVDQYLQPFAA